MAYSKVPSSFALFLNQPLWSSAVQVRLILAHAAEGQLLGADPLVSMTLVLTDGCWRICAHSTGHGGFRAFPSRALQWKADMNEDFSLKMRCVASLRQTMALYTRCKVQLQRVKYKILSKFSLKVCLFALQKNPLLFYQERGGGWILTNATPYDVTLFAGSVCSSFFRVCSLVLVYKDACSEAT